MKATVPQETIDEAMERDPAGSTTLSALSAYGVPGFCLALGPRMPEEQPETLEDQVKEKISQGGTGPARLPDLEIR